MDSFSGQAEFQPLGEGLLLCSQQTCPALARPASVSPCQQKQHRHHQKMSAHKVCARTSLQKNQTDGHHPLSAACNALPPSWLPGAAAAAATPQSRLVAFVDNRTLAPSGPFSRRDLQRALDATSPLMLLAAFPRTKASANEEHRIEHLGPSLHLANFSPNIALQVPSASIAPNLRLNPKGETDLYLARTFSWAALKKASKGWEAAARLLPVCSEPPCGR